MFRTDIFIEGRPSGSGERAWIAGDYRLGAPRSTVWFCDRCGREYARVRVQTGEGWEACHGRCQDCPPMFCQAPGSLWKSWDPEYQRGLSREALEWEFERHWDWLLWKEQRP